MKIGLVSLGCPKNLVDSEVMLGLVQQDGHEVTADASAADVLIVNTCAFIDKAKQESIDTILELAEHKKTGACRKLVVTGCLAERYRDELRELIPEVDVILGTGEVPAIVEAVGGHGHATSAAGPSSSPVALYRKRSDAEQRAFVPGLSQADAAATAATATGDAGHGQGQGHGHTPHVAARHRDAAATRELPTYLYDADTPRVLTTPRHFAYVKIAEGCDYNCSFCIIPALRGQYRSRAVESIVSEARQLAARGVRELLLISQDSTFYGIDRKERGALGRLLRELNAIEGLAWIRLLYLYPTTITDETLDAIAASEKVCRYIDLPLQHGSDAVLRRMRRPAGRASYERLLQRMRDRLPGVTLRTTFIVGFPGETDEEFEELCDFVRTVRFDHVGVFTYSHEEGTAAYGLDDDVPAVVKRRRRDKLMKIQRGIVAKRQKSLIGQTVELIVDGPSKEHELVLQGRLRGHAPDIDPVVYLTDCDADDCPPGSVLFAEIVDARGYDLVARPRPVSEEASSSVAQRLDRVIS
jgi:ribosomal protein S12 methylthiotransferase